MCANVSMDVYDRGSVIAKIVGRNVIEHSIFVQHVPVWVKEELFNGKKLTEIINTKHENIKYLPGCIIPYNVVMYYSVLTLICNKSVWPCVYWLGRELSLELQSC